MTIEGLMPEQLRTLARDAIQEPRCLSDIGVQALATHLLLALDMNLRMEKSIHHLVKELEER